MSTSLARIAANQLNAQKSTGPVTPAGKERSCRNAIKNGVFATLMVVPSAGETAEEFDRFRRRIVSDLAPADTLERELAIRVAGLLWRLRRVVTHEAAALAQQRVALPPHPDEVDRRYTDVTFTIPPNAPTAVHLCSARWRLHVGCSVGWPRVAATEVRSLSTPPASRVLAFGAEMSVPDAVFEVLGRPQGWRWRDFLAGHGITLPEGPGKWTAGLLRQILRAAARDTGQTLASVREAIAARLDEMVVEAEAARAELVEREKQLAAQLLEERLRAGAAAALADEAVLARVAKAEGHLSRELDRVLSQLDRLRAGRRSEASLLGALARAAGPVGFVLPGAGSAPQPPANGTGHAALPAAK